MNAEQEVQDLRNKYTALDIRYKHLLDRVQRLEETMSKVGVLELAHEHRIQGLERDFDTASSNRIVSTRKLQDQIDNLRTP